MIERVPVTVGAGGRIYTDERQRNNIGVDDTPYGRGTECEVGLFVTDDSPEWGTVGRIGTFKQELGYYGEIYVPQPVRSELGLAQGDDVMLTVIAT